MREVLKNKDFFPRVAMANRRADHALPAGGYEEAGGAEFNKKTLVTGETPVVAIFKRHL